MHQRTKRTDEQQETKRGQKNDHTSRKLRTCSYNSMKKQEGVNVHLNVGFDFTTVLTILNYI
jgi:hypothetical protein